MLPLSERLFSDAAEADIFELHVVIHAVFRAFATGARLFDAVKRCDFGGYQPGVDANNAVFKRFRYLEDTREIAGIKIGGQSEYRIVGHGDDLIDICEAKNRSQRPKCFFARTAMV